MVLNFLLCRAEPSQQLSTHQPLAYSNPPKQDRGESQKVKNKKKSRAEMKTVE